MMIMMLWVGILVILRQLLTTMTPILIITFMTVIVFISVSRLIRSTTILLKIIVFVVTIFNVIVVIVVLVFVFVIIILSWRFLKLIKSPSLAEE